MASINFDPEDYLDEIDTDTLEEELETRKDSRLYRGDAAKREVSYLYAQKVQREWNVCQVRELIETNKNVAREIFCDLLSLPHYASVDDIATALKDKIC